MKKIIRISLLLIVIQLALGFNNFKVKADVATQWFPDARIPGYLDDTFPPFLVADQNRTVHAFASQWVNDGGRRLAVVYRKWSLSGGWTRPIDIILIPNGDAQILGAYLDSLDTMHIIFRTGGVGNSAVYYSYAPAANADLVTAWSAPVMVGENALGLNSAAIVGDDQNNLFIIYSGNRDGNGIYYLISENSGGNWSDPSPVFLTNDTTLFPFSLRLAMSPDRKVRAAWNVVTSLGVDERLYFANYDIPNDEWNVPVELDRRIDLPEYFGPSFPALVDNGSDIVVLYNGGNPYAGQFVGPGRPVMRASISRDGGLTWIGPDNPFPLLNGRSGEHSLAVDSLGGVHGLFVMRIDKLVGEEYKAIGGIWHGEYKNGIWTNPDRFIPTYSAHDVKAIVSQGNILLAVWREDPGAGQHGVWFSYTLLDTPELPVIPLATVQVPISPQLARTQTSLLYTPTPEFENKVIESSAPSQWSTNPVFPIIVGVIPVALVVIGIFLAYRFLIKRSE
jgi:hypothetical protein